MHWLDDNQLSGSIASELGLMTNLLFIDLGKFGRRVDLWLEEHDLNPSSTFTFVFFSLLHLELILDGNQLSGSIPSELGLLTNVFAISLCKYGRRVDLWLEEHGLNLQSSTSNFVFFSLLHDALMYLSSFVLGINNLDGTLPSELGNLSNLKQLYLGKCLELVFDKPWMEFVWVFVVLLEENVNNKNENGEHEV